MKEKKEKNPNRFQRFIRLVQRNTTHRRFAEIHIETIINDKVFKNVSTYARKNPSTMLMLTGWNEPWIKQRIQADHLSDKEYANLLIARYRGLGFITKNIGLHVHLFHPRTVKIPDFNRQYNKITESLQFISAIFPMINIKDFAPGWWGYNFDTVRACYEAGIKRFHHDIVRQPPDFHGMEYVKVWRSTDDFLLRDQ